jgi:hypothetical protein
VDNVEQQEQQLAQAAAQAGLSGDSYFGCPPHNRDYKAEGQLGPP